MGEEGQKQAAGRYRLKEYFANILIVKDDAKPENVGKVKLFKFGQGIYDMIMNRMKPEIGDAVDVTDFDNGFDYVLRTYRKGGFIQYDKSYFLSSSRAIPESDQERIFNSLNDVTEFRDPTRFKSESELKVRLNEVLNGQAVTQTLEQKVNTEMSKLEESLNEPKEGASTDLSGEDIDDLFN